MKDFLRYNMVTMNDWLRFHPYEKPSQVDDYYQKLCNRLLKANIDEPLCKDMNQLEYKELTCMLVCWFEDVISETNIWRSFTAEHKRMYGRFLPFYNTEDDYYEDEINLQDIQFLIWHFFSMVENDIFISPYYPIFNSFAQKAYALFEAEYETAPPNLLYKDHFKIPENRDFFKTRRAMDFLTYQSYLNYLYAQQELSKKLDVLSKREYNDDDYALLSYDIIEGTVNDSVSPLLALRANEQLANILGKEHPKYDLIKNISKRYSLTCQIKSINDNCWELEHIATGKHINFAKEILSENARTKQIQAGHSIFVSLAQWGDEWVLTGTMITYPTTKAAESRGKNEKHIFDPFEPEIETDKINKTLYKALMEGNEAGKVTDIQKLIIGNSASAQFVKYLIDNELIEFDQNKEMDDKTIKDNLDFLLRYYKTDDYFYEPKVAVEN